MKLKDWMVYLIAIPIITIIIGILTQSIKASVEAFLTTILSGGIALFIHRIVRDLKTTELIIFDIGATTLVSFIVYYAFYVESYSLIIGTIAAFAVPASYLNIRYFLNKEQRSK